MIFQGLGMIHFDEDDDEDEWGTALASACTLQVFAQAVKDEIIHPIINFVAGKFQDQ